MQKQIYFTTIVLLCGLFACSNTGKDTSAAEGVSHQDLKTVHASSGDVNAVTYSGKVIETMDASEYTYVHIQDSNGKKIWAAIPQTAVKVGEEIVLHDAYEMKDFFSKVLNRKFESIIFASKVIRDSEQSPASADANEDQKEKHQSFHEMGFHGMGTKSSTGKESKIVPFAELKIEKTTVPNGYAVGEIYSKSAGLDKQKVAVKGQVVKVMNGIMGKNWIHLQDGTGDPEKNTHDLVVTSSDTAEKGAIITIEGILAVDKDFGYGYRYDVIVEDAVIK